MPVIDTSAYPPGTRFYFETDERSVFNYLTQTWETEVYYTGRILIVLPQRDPLTGDPLPLDPPVDPGYGWRPYPRPLDPPPEESGGSLTIQVVVRENLLFQGGDYELYSTGGVHPRRVSGWQNNQAIQTSDDARAFTDTAGGGYSAVLTMSDFNFSIPANATITGLKVTVERSKV